MPINEQLLLGYQKGTAVITAIFIVALSAIIATVIAIQQQIEIRYASQLLSADQAYLYAQGVEDWAASALLSRANNPTNKQWPIVLPPTQFANATISGSIEDLQGRFNINSLTTLDNKAKLLRLITVVDSSMSEQDAMQLINQIADWLAPQTASPFFDSAYLQAQLPSSAAHRPMLTISELRSVYGITPNLYSRLEPYLAALPADVKFNEKIASVPVLYAMQNDLTLEQAQAIVNTRQLNNSIDPDNYYLVIAEVNIAKQHLRLYSILQIKKIKDKLAVVTTWQSLATL